MGVDPFREFSSQPLQARLCGVDPPKILSGSFPTGIRFGQVSGANAHALVASTENGQFTAIVQLHPIPQPVRLGLPPPPSS